MGHYKRTLNLLWEKKLLIIMSIIVSLINAPLKSNYFTALGGYFVALYIIVGFLGMIEKDEIGFRSLFKNGNINFSSVVLTLLEVFFISIVDILIVLFFTILPILITGVRISNELSVYIILILTVIVGIYRLPLFLLSFCIPIKDKKEFGKYGIIKAKEILWENKKLWILILPQIIIYMILFLIKFQINDLVMYNIIEIFGAILFLFFMITDYIFVEDIRKNNAEYNIRYDEEHFDERYNGFQGRFIL